jgi:thymidylate synthase
LRGVTPIFVFSGDDIDDLNDEMWRRIQRHGLRLNFGTPKKPEKWKGATEIFAVTQIYGNALTRLYNGDVPKGWKFCGAMAKEYNGTLMNCDKGDQYYTYGQRLKENNCLPAIIEGLSDSIETGVQSNRIVGTIWHWKDIFVEDPPCFQFFQVRLMEENLVSLRTLFRSHCFVNADFANYGALIRFFIDEVIHPAGGELSELINVSTSAQIGDGDVNTVFNRVGNWFDFGTYFNSKGKRMWDNCM